MTAVEHQPSSPKPDGAFLSGFKEQAREKIESLARAPTARLPLPSGRSMKLATDRVRAVPAIEPAMSQMIGMTAIGLGLWGLMCPNAVKRTLGVKSPPGVVRLLFGAREMATGVVLSSDPTKSEMLWARFAADLFDIAALAGMAKRTNPQRGMAKAGLAFVLAVTAMDLFTAVRMSTVKRNCE